MIKISHDGKEFDDINDAIISAKTKAISERIQSRLSHLSEEIKREGGKITVTINGDKASISADGFSPELDEKISLALRK